MYILFYISLYYLHIQIYNYIIILHIVYIYVCVTSYIYLYIYLPEFVIIYKLEIKL
jgi:hypothetical protein